jgi:hypothetical protein
LVVIDTRCREGRLTHIDDYLPRQHRRLAAECLDRLRTTADPAERAALQDEAQRWMRRAQAVTHWRATPVSPQVRASAYRDG